MAAFGTMERGGCPAFYKTRASGADTHLLYFNVTQKQITKNGWQQPVQKEQHLSR